MNAHDPHGKRVATLTGRAVDLNDNVAAGQLTVYRRPADRKNYYGLRDGIRTA